MGRMEELWLPWVKQVHVLICLWRHNSYVPPQKQMGDDTETSLKEAFTRCLYYFFKEKPYNSMMPLPTNNKHFCLSLSRPSFWNEAFWLHSIHKQSQMYPYDKSCIHLDFLADLWKWNLLVKPGGHWHMMGHCCCRIKQSTSWIRRQNKV